MNTDNKRTDDDGIEESYLTDSVDDMEELDYGKLYASAMDNEDNGSATRAKRPWITVIIVTVLVAILITAGVLIKKFVPSKEIVDINTYFAGEEEPFLIVNYEITDYKVLKIEGHYYIPLDFCREMISDKFYFDEGNTQLLYTTAYSIYTIPMDSAEYYIDGSAVTCGYKVAHIEDGVLYVAVEFAYGKGPFSYTIYENPDRLSIIMDGGEYNTVILKNKGVVRVEPGIHNALFADEAGGAVWVVAGDAKQGWLPVKSEDGRAGYVKTSQVASSDNKLLYDSSYVPEEYPSIKKDYDIVLAWHAVYSEQNNDAIDKLLANTKGVTTVSPTWYKVIDADGNLESFADAAYVDKLHDMGYEVWALISDFTSTDKENGWDEKALFANTDSRRKLIDNIMYEIETYGYDGFNIDFEKVPSNAGEDFIQFIRELSIRMRKAGVVLSIDNGVPMEHSMYYDRKAQGECADYVIVMGYDEHWSTCPEAGSVASLPFVTSGIENTLKEVPAEKIINGMPFYTRLWISEKDSDGKETLSSKSWSMQEGLDFVEANDLGVSWDEEAAQYVAAGEIDGVRYSIWLEEIDSMTARFEAVRSYNLAGIAVWRLGFEMKEIWDIFDFEQ